MAYNGDGQELARLGEERGVWLSGCWPDEEPGWARTIRVLASKD
jgi:hypothetical protein